MTAPWEMHLLRISVFAPTQPNNLRAIWDALTSEPPESEEKRAREGIARMSGGVAGALLILTSSPGRLDLHLEPAPGVAGTPQWLAGKADDLISLVEERLPAFCQYTPLATRLAVAGTVWRAVRDTREAYVELASLLRSVTVDPDRMSDLLFRVNWPLSLADGTKVNRITAWAAVSVRGLRVSLLGGAEAAIPDSSYAQLEFDINTVPLPETSFTCARSSEVFAELIALGRENLTKGEVLPL